MRRAGSVPPVTGFPTLDGLTAAFADLAAQHPGIVHTDRVGTSRGGDPITLYRIGTGRLSHLVVGGVHPNEPIGSWTALHLAAQLVDDAGPLQFLDATWGIIPCVDPDGYRLNEGWFADPSDRGHYARHFFRPAPDQQVEWTFPFHYKKAHFDAMLPETRALQAAIDICHPDLYVALHNAELGGVYYYLSRGEPELYPVLHAIPRALGIPLSVGEPESGHLNALAPAIFGETTIEDAYDWAEALGLDPFPPGSGGNSSGAYASGRYGSLALIAELPYWRDPRAEDTTPIAESYADLLKRTGNEIAALAETLGEAVAAAGRLMDWSTPLAYGARAFVRLMNDAARTSITRATEPSAARPATVAERFGCEDTVNMYRLRYGGMLLRAVRAAIGHSRDDAALSVTATALEAQCDQWLRQAADGDASAPIPIEALVGVQYGAILAAASHLSGNLAGGTVA
jgi:hypothetical protein